MAMKKSELRELYLMMFPEYPDIVNITQLQSMLGISRHLAYDLINDGYIRGLKIGNAFRIPNGLRLSERESSPQHSARIKEWSKARLARISAKRS